MAIKLASNNFEFKREQILSWYAGLKDFPSSHDGYKVRKQLISDRLETMSQEVKVWKAKNVQKRD